MSELKYINPLPIDIGDLDIVRYYTNSKYADYSGLYALYNANYVNQNLDALKKITQILQPQTEFILKIRKTLPEYYKYIKTAIFSNSTNEAYLDSIANFEFRYTETDRFDTNLIYTNFIKPIGVYSDVISRLKRYESGFFKNHVPYYSGIDGRSVFGRGRPQKYYDSLQLKENLYELYRATYNLTKTIIDAKESYTGPKPPTLLGRIKSAFTRRTPGATETPAAGGGGGGGGGGALAPTPVAGSGGDINNDPTSPAGGVIVNLPTLARLPEHGDPGPLRGGLRRRTARARLRSSRRSRHH
jgi:hypothetical protein